MEKILHGNLITAIVNDLKDRNFIVAVKDYFDGLREDDFDNDMTITYGFITDIVKDDIVEKGEMLTVLAGCDYSSGLLSRILVDECAYSKGFKDSLIQSINTNNFLNVLNPLFETIKNSTELLEENSGTKKARTAIKEVKQLLNDSVKTMAKMHTDVSRSNILILDPLSDNTSNISDTADEITKVLGNKCKTFPVLDDMTGGGLKPGACYLVGGISGYGKSLFMQNVALYATMSNDPTKFVGESRPVSVFFSYEMSLAQCYGRTIAFLGELVPDKDSNESVHMYTKRLARMTTELMKKYNIKIPIIYITQDESNPTPSSKHVDEQIEKLHNKHGMSPILVNVDYLDRMSVADRRLNVMGDSGAEGSVKTRLKARELRNVALKYNVPIVTATQLNRGAMEVVDAVGLVGNHVLDPLKSFGLSMIAGSSNLRAEVEAIVMVHKIDVEIKSKKSDDVVSSASFIAMSLEKDRDNLAVYKLSQRDRTNYSQYLSYTNIVKNSGNGGLMGSNKFHAVIPMINFRLCDKDYGMSIRMFYLSKESEYISLDNMSKQGSVDKSDSEVENELFG